LVFFGIIAAFITILTAVACRVWRERTKRLQTHEEKQRVEKQFSQDKKMLIQNELDVKKQMSRDQKVFKGKEDDYREKIKKSRLTEEELKVVKQAMAKESQERKDELKEVIVLGEHVVIDKVIGRVASEW